jgi:hypothetical protein
MRRPVVLALAAGLVFLCCLACLAGFFVYRATLGQPPGEGAQAQRGYAAAAPVITALAAYHQSHGSYPASLADLVPTQLSAVPAAVNGYPLEYHAAAGSYTLAFSYAGPGMNHCTYTPENQWHCFGYY